MILSIVVEEQGKLCAAVDADFVVVAEDDIAIIVVELEGAEAQYFVVGEAGVLLDIDVVILVLQFALEATRPSCRQEAHTEEELEGKGCPCLHRSSVRGLGCRTEAHRAGPRIAWDFIAHDEDSPPVLLTVIDAIEEIGIEVDLYPCIIEPTLVARYELAGAGCILRWVVFEGDSDGVTATLGVVLGGLEWKDECEIAIPEVVALTCGLEWTIGDGEDRIVLSATSSFEGFEDTSTLIAIGEGVVVVGSWSESS